MSEKSKKTVGFLKKQIRPITRKNRRTGTENVSDSDSDSDYEEEISPQSPSLLPISDEVIVPSARVYANANRLRPIQFIIIVDDARTGVGTYNQHYTNSFKQFLQQNDIHDLNDTEIEILEDRLITMFEEDFNKEVISCLFSRNVIFDKNKKLGDYYNEINKTGSDGFKNYFYINVQLQDLPIETQDNTAITVGMSEGGGSRKRRTNKKKSNKRRKNKKKSNKRRKTNKRRK